MPAKSAAAIARKKQRKNERHRAKAAAKRAEAAKQQNMTLPMYKVSARRMMPPIGNLSKAELRAMLAEAVANTAAM